MCALHVKVRTNAHYGRTTTDYDGPSLARRTSLGPSLGSQRRLNPSVLATSSIEVINQRVVLASIVDPFFLAAILVPVDSAILWQSCFFRQRSPSCWHGPCLGSWWHIYQQIHGMRTARTHTAQTPSCLGQQAQRSASIRRGAPLSPYRMQPLQDRRLARLSFGLLRYLTHRVAFAA